MRNESLERRRLPTGQNAKVDEDWSLYRPWPEGARWVAELGDAMQRAPTLPHPREEQRGLPARVTSVGYRQVHANPDWSKAVSDAIVAGRTYVYVAADNYNCLPTLLTKTPPLFAIQTLVRTILETAARAWWQLDPAIDAETRVARHLIDRWPSAVKEDNQWKNMILDDLEDEEPDADEGVMAATQALLAWRSHVENLDQLGPPAVGPQTSQLLIRARRLGIAESVTRRGHVIAFGGEHRPRSTDLVDAFWRAVRGRDADGAALYKELSDPVHGATAAVRFRLRGLPFPDDAARFGSDVNSMSIMDGTELSETIEAASIAIFSAVATYDKLCGRSIAPLRTALDEIRTAAANMPGAREVIQDHLRFIENELRAPRECPPV